MYVFLAGGRFVSVISTTKTEEAEETGEMARSQDHTEVKVVIRQWHTCRITSLSKSLRQWHTCRITSLSKRLRQWHTCRITNLSKRSKQWRTCRITNLSKTTATVYIRKFSTFSQRGMSL